jgi:phosphopantothenoylcysteine synthetase/decarboxylase
MRVVITGGPSSEPVDEVRVLTNTSTGELAVTLYEQFVAAGHQVELLLGRGAVCRRPEAQAFTRNEDLEALLQGIARRQEVGLVLHAAALSDFSIRAVDSHRRPAALGKLPSGQQGWSLVLEPKPKVLARLRELFPVSRLIGWKLEQDGDPETVLAKARRQIAEHHLNGCVVNGRAYGPGFGVCTGAGLIHHADSKAALARFLAAAADVSFRE